jgi:hypothetical protein
MHLLNRARRAVCCTALLWACQAEPAVITRVEADTPSEPEDHPIRYACAGFEAAVAADAPQDRLLSHTAKHATELGGDVVEQATRRWALLPPQGLLEEIDAYERSGADPRECAGLRAHLDRLAMLAATH